MKKFFILGILFCLGFAPSGYGMKIEPEEQKQITQAVVRYMCGEFQEGDAAILEAGALKGEIEAQACYGQYLLHHTKNWPEAADFLLQAAKQGVAEAEGLLCSVIGELDDDFETNVRHFCAEWPKKQLWATKAFSPATAADVGLYFLQKDRGNQESDLTNLKLSRLCYFAQGCYAALYTRPLFRETFEAWEEGPILPALYAHYAGFGHSPITLSDDELQRDLQIKEPETTLPFLDAIYENIGQFAGKKLSAIVCEPSSPWRQIWDGGSGKGTTISLDLIYDYFVGHEMPYKLYTDPSAALTALHLCESPPPFRAT